MYMSNKYQTIKLKQGNLIIYDGVILQLIADEEIKFGDLVEVFDGNKCGLYYNNVFKMPLICLSNSLNQGETGEFLLKGIVKLDPTIPLFSNNIKLNSSLYSAESKPLTFFENEVYNKTKNIFPILGYRISNNYFYYNPKNFAYNPLGIPNYIVYDDIFDTDYGYNSVIDTTTTRITEFNINNCCFSPLSDDFFNNKILTIAPFQIRPYRYSIYAEVNIWNISDLNNKFIDYTKSQQLLINNIINLTNWSPSSSDTSHYGLQIFIKDNFEFWHILTSNTKN